MNVKRVIDQTCHVAWGACAIAPALLVHGPIGCALAGVVFAAPRELWDQRPQSFSWSAYNWANTLSDIAFFGVGGFLTGLLLT